MIDQKLVKELISQIEFEIADKLALLDLLKKQLTDATASHKLNDTAKQTDNQIIPEPSVTPKYRYNGSRNPNYVPTATKAIDVIREAGQPLRLREIVSKLGEKGEDISKKNYPTTVYTGLARRPKELIKLADGRWTLVEWQNASNSSQDSSNVEGYGLKFA